MGPLLFEGVHLYIGKHFQSIYTFIHLHIYTFRASGQTMSIIVVGDSHQHLHPYLHQRHHLHLAAEQ